MLDYKAIHILLIYCVQMLKIVCQNLKRIVILWRDATRLLYWKRAPWMYEEVTTIVKTKTK
jgi:hypothetical protein